MRGKHDLTDELTEKIYRAIVETLSQPYNQHLSEGEGVVSTIVALVNQLGTALSLLICRERGVEAENFSAEETEEISLKIAAFVSAIGKEKLGRATELESLDWPRNRKGTA